MHTHYCAFFGVKMRVFIDADGCPVTKICADICKRENTQCIIVCDTSHRIDIEDIKTVYVDKGRDSVDLKISNLITKGDIVVTQDYALASVCLAKKCYAINQNGLVFSNENIESLMFSRYVSKKLRDSGARLKGAKKRSDENDKAFEENFLNLFLMIKNNA